MSAKHFWIAACLGLLSCGRADEQHDSASIATSTPTVADSLVATSPRGVQIWFTLARVATGGDGSQCVERGLEIRHAGARIKVPLLYTGAGPVFLNDSTVRARLWNSCTPGDFYVVNLRTGQPVRETRKGQS